MDAEPIHHAEKAAGITIVLLMGLGIVQVIMGEYVAQSVALTANGIDCIGDGFVSIIVWVGLKFFKKSPDSKFHYGYYKIENLASAAAAVVMMGLAAYIGYRAYQQFIDPHPIFLPTAGAVVALTAAVIAWSIGIHKYRKGRTLGLKSLKLEAINTVKDGTASFLAVVALLLSAKGYLVADAVVGFVIAGIIASIGFATMKEASYMLVDACDTECILTRVKIQGIAEELDAVKAAHIVRLRRTGPVLQGEIEIGVSGDMRVSEANELRLTIQKRVKDTFSDMEQLTVVVMPYQKVG